MVKIKILYSINERVVNINCCQVEPVETELRIWSSHFDKLSEALTKKEEQEMSKYHLDYLEQLEAESIHIFREIAAQFEKPALLINFGDKHIPFIYSYSNIFLAV